MTEKFENENLDPNLAQEASTNTYKIQEQLGGLFRQIYGGAKDTFFTAKDAVADVVSTLSDKTQARYNKAKQNVDAVIANLSIRETLEDRLSQNDFLLIYQISCNRLLQYRESIAKGESINFESLYSLIRSIIEDRKNPNLTYAMEASGGIVNNIV